MAPNLRRLPKTPPSTLDNVRNAAADDAHDADHLFERVGRGVNEKRIVEAICRRSRAARADVDADRYAEFLGFRIEGVKVGMIEISPGGMSGDGDCDKAQLLDATSQLFDRFRWLLHGDQCDAFQPSCIGPAIIREPIVVSARDGAGEIMVF